MEMPRWATAVAGEHRRAATPWWRSTCSCPRRPDGRRRDTGISDYSSRVV